MDVIAVIGLELVLVIALFLLMGVLFWRCQYKVGPHQALVIYGYGGTRVISGGSAIVLKFWQKTAYFSLNLMSFEIPFTFDLYPEEERQLSLLAVVLIKVRDENSSSLLIAIRQFLGHPQEERERLIRLVVEGHLYGVIGQFHSQNVMENLEAMNSQMVQALAPDLERMGLEIVSFTLKSDRQERALRQ